MQNIHEHVLFFPGKDLFCLCDDYQCKIRVGEIEYPTVRHAVIGQKTSDVSIRQKIVTTIMPADLFALESEIKNDTLWSLQDIFKLYKKITKQKFETYPLLLQVLLDTNPYFLKEEVRKDCNCYYIKKLNNLGNFNGKILMSVRKECMY